MIFSSLLAGYNRQSFFLFVWLFPPYVMLAHPFLSFLVSSHNAEPTSIAVTAPQYILEESIDSQKLWKQTAGKRPPQPAEERAYFEKLWSQNFVRSQVQYEMPVEVLTATSPISLSPFGESGGAGAETYGSHFTPYIGDEGGGGGVADVKAAEVEAAEATLMFRMSGTAGASQFYSHARTNDASSLGPHQYHHTPVNKPVRGSGDGSTVVVKGDNVFGTTVSKSFPNPRGGSDTISVSIASYRVVKSRKEGQHAQFLVVYRDGSFRETIGVWKRFSDFERLANKVSFGHESCNVQNCSVALAPLHPLHIEADHDVEPLPNAITSWKLLKKRQRWFRCLDAGYLSLKVFLLERFLHDILFESTSPRLLREFVGVSIHSGSKTSLLNAY